MATVTIQVATASVRDVRKALDAAAATVTDQHVTPGACGYTTITIQSREA